jgi:hypothetical protein
MYQEHSQNPLTSSTRLMNGSKPYIMRTFHSDVINVMNMGTYSRISHTKYTHQRINLIKIPTSMASSISQVKGNKEKDHPN